MDREALKKVRALFLDMDGVLWSDKEEIGNLHEIFESVRESGLKVFFVSNNATRTPVEYCEKLAGFGVSVEPEQFFTSGIATIRQLRTDFPDGPKVYVFGSPSLKKLLTDNGIEVVEENADVVLASMDREQADAALRDLERLTRQWAGNKDKALSLSAGYALASEHSGFTIEKLVKEADQAMYAAKAEYYRNKGHDRRDSR